MSLSVRREGLELVPEQTLPQRRGGAKPCKRGRGANQGGMWAWGWGVLTSKDDPGPHDPGGGAQLEPLPRRQRRTRPHTHSPADETARRHMVTRPPRQVHTARKFRTPGVFDTQAQKSAHPQTQGASASTPSHSSKAGSKEVRSPETTKIDPPDKNTQLRNYKTRFCLGFCIYLLKPYFLFFKCSAIKKFPLSLLTFFCIPVPPPGQR